MKLSAPPVRLALCLALSCAAPAGFAGVSLEWRDDAAPTAHADVPDTSSDLWSRVRDGFRIGDEPHPLTDQHLAWYAARPEYFQRVGERARRYLHYIVQEVESRSMPTELALLPIVESAFNPTALSPSSASGIWQFIPSTGRHYGLHQDDWYDGRRDFLAATSAALDYLGKLYMDFGDWKLALAAYNCGEGCVARAIQKNAQAGLPTDYASLSLPEETRNYVPKLMALKRIVAEPARYNIALVDLPNAPYFGAVDLPPGLGLDTASAARLANVSVDEFRALNAAHSRDVIRHNRPLKVLLPIDRTDRFERELASGEWDKWTPYAARRGESLRELSARLGVSTERLERHNQLKLRHGRFSADQTILIPAAAATAAQTVEPALPAAQYVVAPGDTLYALARRHGVTLAELIAANPGVDRHLSPGQSLNLPNAARIEHATWQPAGAPVSYTVQRGDTLFQIARKHGLSVDALRALNQGVGDTLKPGMQLRVGG